MLDNKYFIHELEEINFNKMIDTVSYDEEIMFYYKNYTEKLIKPDLLGKTVKVTDKQFPNIYNIINKISNYVGIDMPDTYIYEDFYYGIESKGATNPWIEISAKTLSDFTEKEITFLLAKEICDIKLKHTYYYTMVSEVLDAIQNSLHILGSDTLHKYWKVIMYRWGRVANYTSDNFGYLVCGELTSPINSIKKLILNNCLLADNIDLKDYIKQGQLINSLDDDVYNFTKMDELIPYGPFRVKSLISYASSSVGIEGYKLVSERMI